jgi:hypothetical protein
LIDDFFSIFDVNSSIPTSLGTYTKSAVVDPPLQINENIDKSSESVKRVKTPDLLDLELTQIEEHHESRISLCHGDDVEVKEGVESRRIDFNDVESLNLESSCCFADLIPLRKMEVEEQEIEGGRKNFTRPNKFDNSGSTIHKNTSRFSLNL